MLVRILWIKYTINTEVYFVGYLYIFGSDWFTEDEAHWNAVFTVCAFVAGTIGLLKHLSYREFYALQIRVAVMCLASVQYLQICKCQNHSLQDVIKLLLINIWSCFRSTSKQVVEVRLPPVHATRHMCGTARAGTAALRVYLVSRKPVKFPSRSECTGKEKHLLPVRGI
jgi:hypothetical protein